MEDLLNGRFNGFIFSFAIIFVIFIVFPWIGTFLANFWWVILVLTFLACMSIYLKYGVDPKCTGPIVPEAEPPENLTPIEMGLFVSRGYIEQKYIIATIIDLSGRGYIDIENMDDSDGRGSNDFVLVLKNDNWSALTSSEKNILDTMFLMQKDGQVTRLSAAKKELINWGWDTEEKVFNELADRGYFFKNSRRAMMGMKHFESILLSSLAYFGFTALFVASNQASSELIPQNVFIMILALLVSAIIIHVFAKQMIRMTQDGAKLMNRINGFKLYVQESEKYSSQFNEAIGKYSMYLPYAIIFDLTEVWLGKFEGLKGADLFPNYISGSPDRSVALGQALINLFDSF